MIRNYNGAITYCGSYSTTTGYLIESLIIGPSSTWVAVLGESSKVATIKDYTNVVAGRNVTYRVYY